MTNSLRQEFKQFVHSRLSKNANTWILPYGSMLKMVIFKLKKRAYLAGGPLSFHHVWQDITLKLSSKSIFRKFVHWALDVYYYLNLFLCYNFLCIFRVLCVIINPEFLSCNLTYSRCEHAASVLGSRIFIFGGCAGPDIYLNDLHILDTGNGQLP